MPIKSKAQLRKMFSLEENGVLKEGTTKRWIKHTASMKNLPEKVSEKRKSFNK
jgi:hypothetical protein